MADAKGETWEEAVAWLRAQPGQEDLVRDAYFDDPLIDAAERYWRSNEWAAVRPLLGPARGRGRALDAGAGRGIASYALAREGFDVVALEPDPSSLVGSAAIRLLAQETGLPIAVEEEISERLPFADADFDVVFCRAVLHHIDDLPAAMREFHRVLRPGGIFIAVREHVISSEGDRERFFDTHPLHHRYGGENAHPVKVYSHAISESGLHLSKVIGSLDSAVNFGPQSLEQVNRRIADGIMPVRFARGVIRFLLGTPVIGTLMRRMASRIDSRAGRHVSFVARKPRRP